MWLTSYSIGIGIVIWFLLGSYIRFHLTHANGTRNRAAANSITSKIQEKTNKKPFDFIIIVIIITLNISLKTQIRYCNTLLFHLCPMAQKVNLKAPFVVPINARKLLFNTRADFTVYFRDL